MDANNTHMLPLHIPAGARLVVRMNQPASLTPIDANTPQTRDINVATSMRPTYYDVIGHVISWDATVLHMMRDAAANGTRQAQEVWIEANHIVRLKPMPERRFQKPVRPTTINANRHNS